MEQEQEQEQEQERTQYTVLPSASRIGILCLL